MVYLSLICYYLKIYMKQFFLVLGLAAQVAACAQQADAIINAKEVRRIEQVLAADDMQGRATGTPGIDKAAQFISNEFKKAGIQPAPGASGFLQSFATISPKQTSVKGEMDDVELDPKSIVVITTKADFKANEKDGYALEYVKAGDNLGVKAQGFMQAKKNTVVFVDTSFSRNFPRLAGFKRQLFPMDHSVIFVLGNYQPKEFTIKAEHTLSETKMANVVGIIPGKSRPNEYVIFSAHHDHIGIGKPQNGDSIYNGANDDAAGTTAVILLANYFKKLGNNERTLVFATFTAEEIGGFGAQYFSRQFKPEQVMAMFNIEMIGTESKWGKNSAFITGFEKTDMGTILQKNLQGSSFSFHADPYPEQQLFYRSDNATLARLGVPAHTISTAKMDKEPYYHSADDEVETLDIDNMTEIIKAIAKSSVSIVNGKDTPTRVKTEDLR
jgi:Zn-dependent M28 family amino/carboxypeptidase